MLKCIYLTRTRNVGKHTLPLIRRLNIDIFKLWLPDSYTRDVFALNCWAEFSYVRTKFDANNKDRTTEENKHLYLPRKLILSSCHDFSFNGSDCQSGVICSAAQYAFGLNRKERIIQCKDALQAYLGREASVTQQSE